MPAYLGDPFNVCGIKWIASFPDNLMINRPRAHCITILNDTKTGEPICVINSPYISICRTAAVSGVVIKKYIASNIQKKKFNIGILGYGPIGRKHLDICKTLIKDKIGQILVYEPNFSNPINDINISCCWEEVYDKSDILIIATNVQKGYIDRPLKKNSLIMNISLRDFITKNLNLNSSVLTVVDKWDEVCREGTNIEQLYKEEKINSKNVILLSDLVKLQNNKLQNKTIFFNPMGMAIFDIAIASVVYNNKILKEHKNG